MRQSTYICHRCLSHAHTTGWPRECPVCGSRDLVPIDSGTAQILLHAWSPLAHHFLSNSAEPAILTRSSPTFPPRSISHRRLLFTTVAIALVVLLIELNRIFSGGTGETGDRASASPVTAMQSNTERNAVQ
jgi:hypothetical protein